MGEQVSFHGRWNCGLTHFSQRHWRTQPPQSSRKPQKDRIYSASKFLPKVHQTASAFSSHLLMWLNESVRFLKCLRLTLRFQSVKLAATVRIAIFPVEICGFRHDLSMDA